MPSTRVPTSSVVSVGGGPPPPSGYGGGVSAAALTNHINDPVGAHLASAISFAGSNAWADGTTNPSGDVETQLDKLVNDLRGTSITTAGSYKIGADALVRVSFTVPASTLRAQLFALSLASNNQYLNDTTLWYNSDPVVDQSVQDAISQIVGDLSSSADGNNGGARIGSGSRTTWAGDGTTNPASVSVLAAIDKIITDLGSQTASSSGARKVRIEALGNWLDGLTNPATTVFGALQKIITDLSDVAGSTSDGASRIGAAQVGSFVGTTVRAQLDDLNVNWGNLSRTNEWEDVNHFENGLTAGDAAWTSLGKSDLPRLLAYRHNQAVGYSKGTALAMAIGPGESISTDNYPFRFIHQKNNGGGLDAMWLTSNAGWSNQTSVWSHDNTGNRSAALVMDDTFFYMRVRASGVSTWADNEWSEPFRWDTINGTQTMSDSKFSFVNTTTGSLGANPPSGTAVQNQLRAKNVVKAWGTVSNTSGSVTINNQGGFNTTVTGSHTSTDISVTFAQAFNFAPCVVATMQDLTQAFVCVTAVTTSGFSVRFTLHDGTILDPTGFTFQFNFIAMGEMNS